MNPRDEAKLGRGWCYEQELDAIRGGTRSAIHECLRHWIARVALTRSAIQCDLCDPAESPIYLVNKVASQLRVQLNR